jgi:hypothetical protein
VTQLVQLVHNDEPAQHWAWHCAGGVSLSTQVWKQPMSVAQVMSYRQLSVWLQQL